MFNFHNFEKALNTQYQWRDSGADSALASRSLMAFGIAALLALFAMTGTDRRARIRQSRGPGIDLHKF